MECQQQTPKNTPPELEFKLPQTGFHVELKGSLKLLRWHYACLYDPGQCTELQNRSLHVLPP